MAGTLRDDARLHRLWYDLRNQSLFEGSFRKDVQEIDQSLERVIWRIVSTDGDLAGAPVAVSPSVAYAIFDGLFQQALIRHLGGSEAAAGELQANTERILESLVTVG